MSFTLTWQFTREKGPPSQERCVVDRLEICANKRQGHRSVGKQGRVIADSVRTDNQTNMGLGVPVSIIADGYVKLLRLPVNIFAEPQ